MLWIFALAIALLAVNGQENSTAKTTAEPQPVAKNVVVGGKSHEMTYNGTGVKVRVGHIGAINVMPKAELILEICRKELWKEGILSDEFDIEMSDLRAGIVRLWEEGKKQSEIARDMNVPKQTVSDAIKRFRDTGRNEDRARSGRPATATTPSETVCFGTFISRAISLCFFPSSQSRTMPALRSDILKHGIY